jgi:hypothetical protein
MTSNYRNRPPFIEAFILISAITMSLIIAINIFPWK